MGLGRLCGPPGIAEGESPAGPPSSPAALLQAIWHSATMAFSATVPAGPGRLLQCNSAVPGRDGIWSRRSMKKQPGVGRITESSASHLCQIHSNHISYFADQRPLGGEYRICTVQGHFVCNLVALTDDQDTPPGRSVRGIGICLERHNCPGRGSIHFGPAAGAKENSIVQEGEVDRWCHGA